MERARRQPMALPSGQRSDFGGLEPDLDAHLHRLAGHSAGSSKPDGYRADVGGKFLFRRPLGISAAFGLNYFRSLASCPPSFRIRATVLSWGTGSPARLLFPMAISSGVNPCL